MISVVIADDHAMVRHGLRALLATVPHIEVVGEAANGPDALQMVRDTDPDIVLVDVSMPGMSGVDLTRALATEGLRAAVVILSMHGAPAVVSEVLAAGARGYLLKESDGDELLRVIESVAGGAVRVLGQGVADEGDATETLTSRELEVVALIAAGLTNKEIARRLGISTRTVESHRATIMRKLRLRSPADLTLYAVRRGLL